MFVFWKIGAKQGQRQEIKQTIKVENYQEERQIQLLWW